MVFRQLLLLTSLLFLLTACGNKGPVRPLEAPLPGPPQALELRQQGDALLLGWQLPRSNQDGSPLNQPPILDIYRMTYDPQNDCPECFDRSTLLVSIDPELPEPARRIGARYRFLDRQVRPGVGYQYKLVARSAGGPPGRPVTLRQPFTTPIPPPGELLARSRDRSASLQWEPPSLGPDDRLLGYWVYRRLDGAAAAPYPLNPEPLRETRFEDFNLTNGTRYHYRIRALVARDALQVESLASAEQSVIPAPGD